MKTCVGVLLLSASLVLPKGAHAARPEHLTPPLVPGEIQVSPSDYVPFLRAHAIGTQGYVCVAVGSVYSWTAFGPQATLYDDDWQQVLVHYLSPTPYSLLPNPTWQHSRDSSVVWAQMMNSYAEPDFVAPGAIPWLLLEAVVVGDGPTGGDKLLRTARIQRVNTAGGVAPSTGCGQPGDIKRRALVPYEADYYFYKEKPGAPIVD
jgi:hypothetical protein